MEQKYAEIKTNMSKIPIFEEFGKSLEGILSFTDGILTLKK